MFPRQAKAVRGNSRWYRGCRAPITGAVEEAVSHNPIPGRRLRPRPRSMPLPKERLDRIVNVVLRVHSASQHPFVISQMLVQYVDEVTAAVRTGDLAVAEHVRV